MRLLPKAVANAGHHGAHIAAHANLVFVTHIVDPLVLQAPRPSVIKGIFGTESQHRTHARIKSIFSIHIGFRTVAHQAGPAVQIPVAGQAVAGLQRKL